MSLNTHEADSREERPADAEFSQSQLITSWRIFANSLPVEESAMKGRMENIQPELQSDGHTFVVVADNEVVERQFAALQSRILQHLRRDLRNSLITMVIRVRSKEERPVVYDKRQQLKQMGIDNPDFVKLYRMFELEME